MSSTPECALSERLAERYCLDPAEAEELHRYLENRFHKRTTPDGGDGFLAPWREWISLIPLSGAAEILNRCVIPSRPVHFRTPDSVRIEIYPSAAGDIPIITLGDDRDFEEFVTNLVYKGERPEGLSKMGASFIHGKEQRFIVLSEKPYSNVPAQWMGLDGEEWRQRSMILRREHECAHYYTCRYYGLSRDHLHDELMADFLGIYAAFGRYEARWFKHFMGVDETPASPGGRLTLYTAGLSPKVKEAVGEAARLCADALEAWSRSVAFKSLTERERIEWLCDVTGSFG